MGANIARVAIIAALLAGTASTAYATPVDGWYGRLDLGYSLSGDADIKATTGSLNAWGKAKFKNDWMESGGLGFAFHNGFRLEGELGHRFNDIKVKPTIDAGGSAKVWSAMGNLFYDFNHGGNFRPYLGAGLGYGQLTLKARDLAPAVSTINDEDSGWAWQALAGFGISLSPNVTLDLGYRYFVMPGLNVHAAERTLLSVSHDVDYHHQAATIGLRWAFGQAEAPPPPPPPPPPVVAPATSMLGPFKVYFQWDKSNLTKEAMATVDEVANQVKNKKIKTVHIEGDTDTSGSDAYNQALSDARSAAVRDRLIADGVPASAIDTVGLGETNPAVKTGDAVKEPLNRRAEITITILNN